MTVESLIRKHFENFRPYRSARSEIRSGKVFLDANELSTGSPFRFGTIALHRYPDPSQYKLREKLARRHRVSPDMVFAGVGSDEIIDLLIRLFCEPGRDRILVHEPTYGVYRVAAGVNDVDVVSRELDGDFQIDRRGPGSSQSSAAKLVFFCSPNNPTGNLLRKEDILLSCQNSKSIVVVDEAYIDFAGAGKSMIPEVEQRENLIVLRTMSKSFGLAGIRLGYCIANPRIIEYLLKIKAPYNINVLTSHIGIEVLRNKKFFLKSVKSIVSQRTWMGENLFRINSVEHVFPSDANFLLVKFRDAEKIYNSLLKKGIVVRKRSEPRLRDCLRITVGTPDENRLLVKEIQKISC